MAEYKETYRVLFNDVENGRKWYEDYDNAEEAEKRALEFAWSGTYVRIACI